jgi:hypothetical protein
MAVKLNPKSVAHARQLISNGRYVIDEPRVWSAHRPTPADENRFIAQHGFPAYSLWYLGIDDDARPETKRRYRFPYGDFEAIHRCGVMSAEFRAKERGYDDIRRAAAQLRRVLSARKTAPRA